MNIFSYRTILRASESQYKEKGSKFLGFALPVESEEDVKLRMTELKKKFFDARHYCFAYVLGADKNRFRAFDDGEPNHSAGDPILGQIRSKNLTNLLVVVIRYFGGVKLGVGGLISAYKTTAGLALDGVVIIEKEILKKYSIHYPYASNPDVMKLVKEFDIQIQNQIFETECRLEVCVRLRVKSDLENKVKLLNALGILITLSEIQVS